MKNAVILYPSVEHPAHFFKKLLGVRLTNPIPLGIILFILLLFSCKSVKETKITPVSNIYTEYRAMGNSFADVSFVLYKNKTFKINISVLSDKSKAGFDGSWEFKNNKFILYFNQKITRDDAANIFDIPHNKDNKVIIEIASGGVLIPEGIENLWLFNVLCKRKLE
jgi:hypothetical protein